MWTESLNVIQVNILLKSVILTTICQHLSFSILVNVMFAISIHIFLYVAFEVFLFFVGLLQALYKKCHIPWWQCVILVLEFSSISANCCDKKNFTLFTHVFMCFLWFSQVPTVSLNCVNRLVFIVQFYSVICKLDTKYIYIYIYIIETNVSLYEK
jgi:hypothetical protein